MVICGPPEDVGARADISLGAWGGDTIAEDDGSKVLLPTWPADVSAGSDPATPGEEPQSATTSSLSEGAWGSGRSTRSSVSSGGRVASVSSDSGDDALSLTGGWSEDEGGTPVPTRQAPEEQGIHALLQEDPAAPSGGGAAAEPAGERGVWVVQEEAPPSPLSEEEIRVKAMILESPPFKEELQRKMDALASDGPVSASVRERLIFALWKRHSALHERDPSGYSLPEPAEAEQGSPQKSSPATKKSFLASLSQLHSIPWEVANFGRGAR